MKVKIVFFILINLFFNMQMVSAAENDYGVVKAWFDGKNATVEGTRLKIGEPVEIKVEVTSKINGDVSLKLYEPGVTRAFKVINGPNDIEKWTDNLNTEPGWSKTYIWTVAPNGAWKNGNAPLNLFVQFNNGMKDKTIDFTIANPYILDEQYTGASSESKPTSSAAETSGASATKSTPFPSVLLALAAVLAVWRLRRKA